MVWVYGDAVADRAADYRDLLTDLVAAATSQGVATAARNAGGTGYAVGDILSYTHAGAFHPLYVEVTKETAGVIDADGLRIVSSGAFSNRIATVAVNSGGTGYSADEIVEIQGGTSRCKGKAKVLTAPAGVVATIELFEAGSGKDRAGAYTVAPTLTGAATVGVGPAGFGGNDDLTVDVTMTGLTGLTGLALTAVTGSGINATVDITLAEAGMSVDSRNTNDASANSLTDEKEVTLVGDASGKTNKPYLHFRTETGTSGIDTRYGISCEASIAHNPAIAVTSQPGFKKCGYILCDENQDQAMRWWFSIDGFRIAGVVDINPQATVTDDGEYMQFYSGFGDSYALETEDPYPFFLGAAGDSLNIDPSVQSTSITGLAECASPGGDPPMFYYRSETGSWVAVENSDNGGTGATNHGMFPVQEFPLGGDAIAEFGPVNFESIAHLARGSATRRLLPVPGTTPQHLPIPLIVVSKQGGASQDDQDTIRMQLRGCFWVSGSNDSAADLTNFSEGKVEVGSDPTTSDRYRVFHQHVNHKVFHYVGFKEDV